MSSPRSVKAGNEVSGQRTAEEELAPFDGVDFSELERSLRRPRTLVSVLLTGLVPLMTIVALGPLFSVVWMLLWRGGRELTIAALTQLPLAPLEQGGGVRYPLAVSLTIIAVGTLSRGAIR